MLETNFVKLCNISDIPENEMKIFNIRNIEFVVVNNNKEFHVVYNKCPHMGNSLGDGSFDDSGYLTCPLHKWQFNLETGKDLKDMKILSLLILIFQQVLE